MRTSTIEKERNGKQYKQPNRAVHLVYRTIFSITCPQLSSNKQADEKVRRRKKKGGVWVPFGVFAIRSIDWPLLSTSQSRAPKSGPRSLFLARNQRPAVTERECGAQLWPRGFSTRGEYNERHHTAAKHTTHELCIRTCFVRWNIFPEELGRDHSQAPRRSDGFVVCWLSERWHYLRDLSHY